MSSYVCGSTSVLAFTVNQDAFQERVENMLRVWDFEIYLDAATAAADYAALHSVVCALVNVRVCPGSNGSTPFMDISGQGSGVGGGTGSGTLTLDNLADSPYVAVLNKLSRPSAYPGGGRRCQATFMECPA